MKIQDFCIGCMVVATVILPPLVSRAEEDQLLESISSFDTVITVREDATIHVIETVEYDFTTQERHGIIRDIPRTQVPGTFEKMSISNIKVEDGTGYPHMFSVTGIETPFWGRLFSGLALNSDVVSIKIGNPQEYVSGKNTYIISYDVKHALGYFDDRTEIYWNATGDDWLVPIERASVQIVVPGNQVSGVTQASYCGRDGETESCGEPYISYDEKKHTTIVTYDIPKRLVSGEGVTVATGFSKDIVATPAWQDWFMYYLARYWGITLVPFVLYFWFRKSFIQWRIRRRFYQNNTVVAEYDAGGYSPIEASVILQGKVTDEAISAQIIQLATRGYLKIKKDEAGEYLFIDTGRREGLSSSDEQLLTTLVEKTTEELKKSLYLTVNSLRTEIQSELYKKGYTVSSSLAGPGRGTALFVGLFVAVNPGVFIWILLGVQAGLAFSGSAALIGALSLLFKTGENHLTQAGFEVARKLKGLRLYIDVAEEERIKFHNAPEKTTELFEELLPYAMVFKLEEQWAKEFASLYVVPPTWYEGTLESDFSSIVLAHTLSDFSANTRFLHMRPMTHSSSGSSFGSSGSSFSGSSGSGSSGGGGGGGGGRSW